MKILLISIWLCLACAQTWAGSNPYILGGRVLAAPACTATVASQSTSNEVQNLFGTTGRGATFSADSGDVICGMSVSVNAVGSTDPPHTLTCRIGTAADLTSNYIEGSVVLGVSDTGTQSVSFSGTLTGSTTYYVGCYGSGALYQNRIVLDGADASAIVDTAGDWIFTSGSGLIVYTILGQE